MSDKNEKTETKTAAPISDAAMAAAVKYVSEQMIPAAVAAAVSATTKQPTHAIAPAPARAGSVLRKCHDCGQAETGCEGKHVQMVVYPTRYPQHADYFPGVIINGQRYLSNDSGHKVTVPANCEASILAIVAGFEQNEQDMATGRKAERHSGRVSPHGANVQPANQAWR